MSSAKFALVKIPACLNFDDLHLHIDPDSHTMQFDWAPVREILEANADLTLMCDDDVCELIGAWYGYLRLTGYRDDVAEEYFLSCEVVQTFGLSHLFAGPDSVH